MSGMGQDRLILIVEDNDKNRKLVRDVLQFHGFQTLEATSGEQGIELAKAHRPDVILMDIGLPGIGGIVATQRLNAEQPATGTPIVALTASVMRADRARLEEVGFAGVIAKPIDVLRFPEQVMAYCSRAGEDS